MHAKFIHYFSHPPGSPNRRGMALVVVLAMLVLLLVTITAFLSRATLNRQTASASTADATLGLLVEAATGYVIHDFLQEIEAGSEDDPLDHPAAPVKQPRLLPGTMLAPGVAPQRAGDQGVANLVKASRHATAFFDGGLPGFELATGENAAARAAQVSTAAVSLNGRALSPAVWQQPRLMNQAEATAFSPPDWIYVDRSGRNPDLADSGAISNAVNPAPANLSHVMGRFAYTVYDLGGLIDINVAGNRLDDEENARRGRLHHIEPPVGGDSAALVAWRTPQEQADHVLDPRENFLGTGQGGQTLLGRRDLLEFAARESSPVDEAALPLLTTFTRDVNVPAHRPDVTRPRLPNPATVDQYNPAILNVRFEQDVILNRPEGAVRVPAGTPVMPRRFPLSKLALFEEENPDPAEMEYYFGLQRVPGSRAWRYIRAVGGFIATLEQVRDARREPNFFEVLSAGIYTGSLGLNNIVDTYSWQVAKDASQDRQILQIGANIIDQWDADDRPTILRFPSGAATGGEWEVAGIENLPYINQIGLVGWRPPDNRDLFQTWALFTLWNPHRNATTPPVGVDRLRIVPISGTGRSILHFTISITLPSPNPYITFREESPDSGGTRFRSNQSATVNIVSINQGREFSFSPAQNFSEPRVVGETPQSQNDTPGLLVHECEPGMAVPPYGQRHPRQQITINEIMDLQAPYTSSHGWSPGPLGERVYPEGTTFTNLNPDFWLREDKQVQGTDADGNVTQTTEIFLSGKFGVKAHNEFRLRGEQHGGLPVWRFALQARYTGDPAETWYTIQEFEGFLREQSGSMREGERNRDEFLRNTHHSQIDAPLDQLFYSWLAPSSSVGMMHVDPRTTRLGLASWLLVGPTEGLPIRARSIRSIVGGFDPSLLGDTGGTQIANYRDWAFGYSRSPGRTANLVVHPNFEVIPQFLGPPQRNRAQIGLHGFVTNDPGGLDSLRPMRYRDPDNVIRPGDGYFGALPTVPGRIQERPLILNRPFRSVGELGYAFRDLPWKSVDFSTRFSADLGLLDLFSLTESTGDEPLLAGSINLNTRSSGALAAALTGAATAPPGIDAEEEIATLTSGQAAAIAEAIVAESSQRPFLSRGDLVSRALDPAGGQSALDGLVAKPAREAAVRALAEAGTTRTWNFLIDLVAQNGAFTPASQTAQDFQVRGQKRVWIYLSIDRMTGTILEMRKEPVDG